MKNLVKTSPYLLLLFCVCFGCKTTTETTISSEENTVLIQLSETASTEALELQFETVQLQQKKQISNTMRIYLFTFNSQKIKAEALIDQLNESDLVLKAQTNQQVSNRN